MSKDYDVLCKQEIDELETYTYLFYTEVIRFI